MRNKLNVEKKCSKKSTSILISILIDFNIKVTNSHNEVQMLTNQICCKIKSRKANISELATCLNTRTHTYLYTSYSVRVYVKGKRYLFTTLCNYGSGTKGILYPEDMIEMYFLFESIISFVIYVK